MEDVKPRYPRKLRKDGTTRKARVFGKPWWYEKAAWSEELWNERRAAILERVREKWPNWSSLEQDAPSEHKIKEWIKPVVVTFDDTAWHLPGVSSVLGRLEHQLAIYSAWARVISRESSRTPKHLNLPDQDTTSDGLQLATTTATTKQRLGSRLTESAESNMARSRDIRGSISHQWRQTRPIDTWRNQDPDLSDKPSRTYSLSVTPKVSDSNGIREKIIRTPSRRSTDTVSHRLSVVSPKARLAVVRSYDEETEMTEVSDSEPMRHAESTIERPKRKSLDHFDQTHASEHHQKWRDRFWDDVVVTIDATVLNGEDFPIPMTMLKPGSCRAICRWDEFELDSLYARFKIEAGLEIDRDRYVLAWSVNGTSISINTPGKYKLMLKEFAEKTRRSSAMVLYLRILDRASVTRTPIRDGQRQSLLRDQGDTGMKRSQFIGATSDYSSDSDSDSEPTERPSKRQKRPLAYESSSPHSESLLARRHRSRDAQDIVQAAEKPPPQVRSDIVKARDTPEEWTQDSS